MSEGQRHNEANRDLPWVQRPEPRRPVRPAPVENIEPGRAAEFRRRLDYQGSAELIPTAGPDAPSEQGPAIKAVWEPAPPDAAGSRRQGRRSGHDDEDRGRGRRRAPLILGGLAVVAVAAVGFVGLSGGDRPGPPKGSAATFLPAASPTGSADPGQSGNGSNGANVSLSTGGPTTATATSTASASTSPSPSGTASRTASPAPSTSPSAPKSPSKSPKPSRSPRQSPSPTHTSCFLFFCN